MAYWQQGVSTVAGIDEVGMGAWAGPVVAAAVIFSEAYNIPGLNDSKKLTPKKREALALRITKHAQAWSVGEATAAEIDQLTIRAASHLAMRRAVEKLPALPQLLLIDGLPAQPHPTIPAVTLVRGDSLSCSIAAASILAKVHRDRHMVALHERWPHYSFASHKGYGSPVHQAALAEYGVCSEHRRSYAPIAQVLTNAASHSTLQT